jgi:hypothetical protein
MIAAFNLLLIGLALLIAYWWANQGLFSALLHFVCVIVAGGIAFAIWEPLAVAMLSRGVLENYAWGIALLAPFALSLLLLRIASDRLVPDNVNFPQWANYTVGGALGLGAGVLTMGMLLIGGGFVQSSDEIMGFAGATRTTTSRGQPDLAAQRLWVPMHELTADFYGLLSVGAFAPEFGRPLRTAYPSLAATALGLHRDSAAGGRARTSVAPDSVTVGRFMFSPDFRNSDGTQGAYVVELDLDNKASDKGGFLTVSASQIRLIERVPPRSVREPEAVYPDRWSQPGDTGLRELWLFDDLLNYATNVPGQQQTKFFFVFPASRLGGPENAPEFVQFKGLRLRLPALEPVQLDATAMTQLLRGADPSRLAGPVEDPTAKMIASRDLTVDNGIAPANASVNTLTTMEQSDQFLTEGRQDFPRGGATASPVNRIKGIYAREGTAIVRLNLSRQQSSVDVWNDRSDNRTKAGETAPLLLVDERGNTYAPIGYIWVRPDGVEIRLDPRRGIEAIKDFPPQPSSGTHELYALFNPTAGVTIKSVRLGNVVLANANLLVRGTGG